MDFQKRYFYFLLLSCVVLTVFSGCDSIPKNLTEKDFYELKNYPPIDEYGEPKDPKKPEDIQYYVSKNVTLELYSAPSVSTVDYLGNLIKYNWTGREQVTIAKNEKGKLLSIDKNGYLIIGFEENNPECFLKFGRLPERDDGLYYLILDDIQNSTIMYGDDVYDVRFFSSNVPPHLKIKEKVITLPYNYIRDVPGWPVYR